MGADNVDEALSGSMEGSNARASSDVAVISTESDESVTAGADSSVAVQSGIGADCALGIV
jgi:hypothetical protein